MYRLPTPTTFAGWTERLRARGLVVLPQSHAVPIDLWLRTPDGRVLHLQSRGTRVSLCSYLSTDLTTLLLRAECDCEEHRQAGAAGRLVLNPGALPESEVVYDGAAEAGWKGYEAGLLDVASAAVILDVLLARSSRQATLAAS